MHPLQLEFDNVKMEFRILRNALKEDEAKSLQLELKQLSEKIRFVSDVEYTFDEQELLLYYVSLPLELCGEEIKQALTILHRYQHLKMWDSNFEFKIDYFGQSFFSKNKILNLFFLWILISNLVLLIAPFMTFKFLQAFNGDSILISYEWDRRNINILIDGGTSATYQRKGKKGKMKMYHLFSKIKD
jgi:hypothetical protein